MRRGREAVAEGCTASDRRRHRHGMLRVRSTIAEGGTANVWGWHGELAASTEGGVGTGHGERVAIASMGTSLPSSGAVTAPTARRNTHSLHCQKWRRVQ